MVLPSWGWSGAQACTCPGEKGSSCQQPRQQRGFPFCPALHPNAEVENDIFLLEVSGSSVNHCVVTADPNTSSGWVSAEEGRSNQSVGKGNHKSNGLGVFFPLCSSQSCISTNKQSFPEQLPRGPSEKQTSICRSQTQPPNRTQEEILAQHSSPGVVGLHCQRPASIPGMHRRGSCHTVSQQEFRRCVPRS